MDKHYRRLAICIDNGFLGQRPRDVAGIIMSMRSQCLGDVVAQALLKH